MRDMVRDALNRYRERKRRSRLPATRQWEEHDYDPDEILRGLLGVRVELTDFRKTIPPSNTTTTAAKSTTTATRQWEEHDYDPNEILRGLFGGRVELRDFRGTLTPSNTTTIAAKNTITITTATLPPTNTSTTITTATLPLTNTSTTITTAAPQALPPPQRRGRVVSYFPTAAKSTTTAAKSTTTNTTAAPQALPPPQRRGRWLSYSSSSDSDSEPDEGLVAELERMLAEPEDPVKRRLSEIRKK